MKFRAERAGLVKLSGTCSLDNFVSEFHSFVCDNVRNLNQDIIDPSLIRTLCNWLENCFEKNTVADEKVNKKQIVIDEYLKMKPQSNSPEHINVIDRLIEDFHNSKQIKKIPYLKYFIKQFKKFTLKKH